MKSIPQVIILGNGFDLAHGLETSFPHFANYYIEQKIIPELENVIFNKATHSNLFQESFVREMIRKGSDFPLKNDYNGKLYYWIKGYKFNEVIEYLKINSAVIKNFIINTFLGKLYSNEYKNWFDIENAYFYELVQLKAEAIEKGNNFSKERLLKLNKEFLEIKIELHNLNKSQDIQNFLDTHLKSAPAAYVINFNYTNTIELYLDKYKTNPNFEVNYVHGSLEKNNIIFGYGNDKNRHYQDIKNLEIDEFLTFFKTFEYLRTPNYNMVAARLLETYSNYNILVLGHSLGTTDKTLLGEVFNSSKCWYVSLFKRKDLEDKPDEVDREFNKLTYAASRIFSREETMRKKIKNFEQSSFFP